MRALIRKCRAKSYRFAKSLILWRTRPDDRSCRFQKWNPLFLF